MKRLTLLAACIVAAFCVRAQLPDSAMSNLMLHREYDRFEVEYNAIPLAQQFYQRKSMDSFNALISFWKIHCPANERLFTITLLNSIRNNDFKESVSENEFLTARVKNSYNDSDIYKSSIFAYMKEYKAACSGRLSEDQYDLWVSENYPYPKDYTEYRSFYKKYYTFLQQMAKSLQGQRAYSPAEQFLLRFYANPDSVQFADIDTPSYSGSLIYEKYQAYKKYRDEIHGVSTSIQMGVWIPNGNLSLLGSHPYMSMTLGGRSENIMVDCLLGFRWGEARNNYNVLKDGVMYSSHHYVSWFTGIDFGCKLYRTHRSEFDALAGVGYEEIQTLSVTNPNDTAGLNITQNAKSFYANAGLGYKIYVRNAYVKGKYHRSYFSLQVKYNYSNFNNRGGTSFAGNAITVGLVYGGYSYKFSKYPYLEK